MERDVLAESFEGHRGRLTAVAARILGSSGEAEDAVQETWLRLSRSEPDAVENLGAWLTTVVSRVCLNMLQARRSRPETLAEPELPELPPHGEPAVGAPAPAADPEQEALLAESVGLALHVVMDSLTPAERVAFVLHDIFDLPFGQVADVLGRSTNAVKMLSSRARRRVRLVPPEAPREDAGDRAVVDAFLAAAGSGDLSALLALLAPDAQLHAFRPQGVSLVQGAATIAAQAKAGARRSAALKPDVRPVTARGAAGVLLILNGRPVSVMTFTVRDGLITEMRSVADPARLAQIVPSWAV